MSEFPAISLLIGDLSGNDVLALGAASVFFIAGVALLVSTLRGSLIKSKLTLEEEARRKQAESQYWRTMESAIEKLGESVAEIDKQIEERCETLNRLTDEAAAVMARLEAKIAEQEREGLRPSAGTSRQTEGRVVDMKTAPAAVSRRNTRVCELFDAGDTIQDISRETGLTLGEIELILAIRDKGQGTAGAG